MSELYYNSMCNLLEVNHITVKKQSSRSYPTIGNMDMHYKIKYKDTTYPVIITFKLDLDYNIYDTVFIVIYDLNKKTFNKFDYTIKKDTNIRSVYNTTSHIPDFYFTPFATDIINKINKFNHLISIDILQLKYLFDYSESFDYEDEVILRILLK